MRILRFICWLRGFHRLAYQITKYEAGATPDGRGVSHGSTGPCKMCHALPADGPMPYSWVTIEWLPGTEQK